MKLRTFTIDLALDETDPPALGDLITSRQAAYIVRDVRPVESRVWANRWSLRLERLTGNGCNVRPPELTDGQRWFPTIPYRPGERPGDHFR